MKKLKVVLSCLVAAALIAGVAGSVLISVKTYTQVQHQNDLLQAQIDENKPEDNNHENDITIGGQYHILDTSAVSEAYINNDDSKLDDTQKKTLKLASDLTAEIIKDDMSEYEKELAIYNWLTDNVTFDSGSMVAIPDAVGNCDKPIGVLQTKKAVCVGFATTFRLLCNMQGIECHVVHDTELSHSWDKVKIEGDWYNVDCTFDAGDSTSRYKNFNMSDVCFKQSHSWEMDIYPAATATKYSYAVQNAVEMKDIYKIPKNLKKQLDQKKARVYYRVATDSSDDITTMLTEIQSRMYTLYPDGYLDYSFFPIDEENFVVGVYLPTAQNADTNKDENYQKIIDAIDHVFGEQSGTTDGGAGNEGMEP